MNPRLNRTDRQIIQMVAAANAMQVSSPSIRDMMKATGMAMGAITYSIKRLIRLKYLTRLGKGKCRTLHLHPDRIAYSIQQGKPTRQYYQVF